MTIPANNMFVNEEEVAVSLDDLRETLGAGANAELPSPKMLTHYVLDANRKLFLDEVVDYPIIETTKRIMLWNMEDAGKPVEERSPIWLYIMNYGGALDYAWQLIDIIAASETPVYTVNIGVCASAAALIYLTGHRRFMMPRATLLIHEGSISVSGDAQKFNDAADSYKKMLNAMKSFILSTTKIPASTLSKKKNNDWELDAKYCFENGACEQIVSSLGEIL